MKATYIDKETHAIADVYDDPQSDKFIITRINVPKQHRKQGHGTRLLQRILDDADKEGVKLALFCAPSGGLTFRQLVNWYKRHGFDKDELPNWCSLYGMSDIQGGHTDGVLVRYPKVTANV